MNEHYLKVDEVQLKLLLYGLMHIKSSLRCCDVLLDSRNVSRFNELMETLILSLPLSSEKQKFYSAYQIKLFDDK